MSRELKALVLIAVVFQLMSSWAEGQTFPDAPVARLGHAEDVLSVAFSPNGQMLAVGSQDKTVRLWDVTQPAELGALIGHTAPVRSVAFSPDGKLLASGSADYTVRLWNVAQQKEAGILQGHTNQVYSVVFSPDGLLLASGSSDNTMRLWDMAQQKQVAVLTGHNNGVTSVAFSPDGKTLASGSYDNTVRLWSVAQRLMLVRLPTDDVTLSVVFSPDGKLLASGHGDNKVRLWDAVQRTQLAVLQGHIDYVRDVVFSPDGRFLASGSDDNTVRLWDVAQKKEVKTLQGHTNDVISVAFSPDGKTLASGSIDDNVLLWGVLPTLVSQSPGISLSANSINMGTVSKGLSRTATLTVTNSGGGTLSVSNITASNAQVTVSPKAFNLSAGASRTITIVYTPQLIGTVNATLSISHNASGSPTTATVRGTGSAPPRIARLTIRLAQVAGGTAIVDKQFSINAGSVLMFAADGMTANDSAVAITPTWKVVGEIGAITSAGRFAGGTKAGNRGSVVASAEGVSDSVQVIILPGSLARLTIKPAFALLASGQQIAFTAEAVDTFSNVINDLRVFWHTVGSIGTINKSTGVFKATTARGIGYVIAFAASGANSLITEGAFGDALAGVSGLAKIVVEQSVPATHILSQNYPNPFNPETTISYELPEMARIRLNIYTLSGGVVRTLVHDELNQPGRYAIVWDGRDEAGRAVASGAYLYRLEAVDKGLVETKRMVLVR